MLSNGLFPFLIQTGIVIIISGSISPVLFWNVVTGCGQIAAFQTVKNRLRALKPPAFFSICTIFGRNRIIFKKRILKGGVWLEKMRLLSFASKRKKSAKKTRQWKSDSLHMCVKKVGRCAVLLKELYWQIVPKLFFAPTLCKKVSHFNFKPLFAN